jgi:tRNA(fMet)-specific endonuclease VapC
MRYLLDTNICIFIINHQPPLVRARFERVPVGEIGISSITLSELQYGAAKSGRPTKNMKALRKFLLPLDVLAYDEQAAERYGQLRASLEKAGTPIGPMDLMIAAHALSARLTVITNNRREFDRVPGLVTEDWTEPESLADR